MATGGRRDRTQKPATRTGLSHGRSVLSRSCSDQLADGLGTFDADELLMQAGVEVVESVGVEAELVQDRSMEVLDVKAVLDGRAAELVGSADAGSTFDSAAGHPHGEAEGVVVAAGALGELGGGLAAELAAPDDERLIEQAARVSGP